MRLVCTRGAFDDDRESRQLTGSDRVSPASCERRQIGEAHGCRVRRELWKNLRRIAEHRMRPRVRILHIEDRIVLRLLQHLREIEIELASFLR